MEYPRAFYKDFECALNSLMSNLQFNFFCYGADKPKQTTEELAPGVYEVVVLTMGG